MSPTVQEIMAGVVVLGCMASIVGLTIVGAAVPDEIKTALAAGLAYIFGSRTSRPGEGD